MTQHAYSYAILQYRHDVWVGEALNVGVLLFSEEARFLKLKARSGRGRISLAYPDLNYGALRVAVKALERRFESIASRSGFLFPSGDALGIGRWVLTPDDSSLSWGMTGAGLTDDPMESLEKVYARFVGRYDQESGRDVRTDDMVFEAVRRKLEIAELNHRLQAHVVRSKFASVTFDHAIENGAWHVIQPLSFDSANEQRMLDKAAKWVGILQSISKVEDRVRPYFVTGAPQNNELMPQYRRMVEFLKESPMSPIVLDEARAGELVDKVAARLAV